MSQQPKSSYGIRAVERVCDILDLLQNSPQGASLGEIAKRVALPKSSAFRYLQSLESRNYVERESDAGPYRLGAAFLPLYSRQLDLLARLARPLLERLRDELEETCNLGILDGNLVVYLEIVESQRSMRLAARPRDQDPIHCTALGKAIAAELDADRVTAILDAEGMARRTEATITNRKRYFAELERVRESGFAVDDGENEVDGRCVGVVIEGTRSPAALSVSAPASRLSRQQVPAIAERLTAIASQLSLRLQGDGQVSNGGDGAVPAAKVMAEGA